MAGLACASRLRRAGREPLVVEAGDAPGGRVRTDRVDGFALDRGFQVFLTAYPAARRALDVKALEPGAFAPGARVRLARGDCFVGDPLRRPRALGATLRAPVGGFGDKLRVLQLRARARRIHAPRTWPNEPTGDFLRGFGFSERMVERFFRPFFAGVFLERELATSARMFGFVYGCFAQGEAALPRGGMEAIPRQLADRVGRERIRLETPVEAVERNAVHLANGDTLGAKAVVSAVGLDQARRWFPSLPERRWNGGTTWWFDAAASPLAGDRALWLNASGRGRVNHVAAPSDVAADYAPEGRSLVAVNLVDGGRGDRGEAPLRAELAEYFGAAAHDWRVLRVDRVPRALPAYDPAAAEALARTPSVLNGVYLCGDAMGMGALESAIGSGAAAAERVLGAG